MKKKKIYLGFTVDMDRAYSESYNCLLNFKKIKKDSNNFNDRLLKKKEYIDGINNLKKFYSDNGCDKSTLWVVNEAAYYQVLNFPKLLLNLKNHGDIGLHTHFNSSVFNGMDYFISNNSENYFVKGLVEPKKRLEQLLDIKIDIFKSGNHLKNDSFFKDLYDAGFNYDVTPQVNTDFKDKDGKSCANYTDWEDGCLPRYKNGILIIPEIDLGINNIKNHIDNLPENAPALLRFQNHPWDYKDLTLWKNVLNFCKKNYDVEFKSFYEMINIFKDYQEKNEKVKLVIWDLDEVVWDGSLVENTINNSERMVLSSYLIKYLNSHGIINSICSKNNFEEAKKKLIELELWDYFVFPKIQFSGKGNLVKQIIEECNFLPKNVLFIDDNHSNRKEVQFYNKDIMVEDEYFIFKMLNDGRFYNLKEKNRLPDYKILEEKSKELNKNFKGDNYNFLRSLDIKCSLTEINNLDNSKIINRIFELINRTNQLNYTKVRLNSIEEVKEMIINNDYVVYIVEGMDKYAFYGIIGTVIYMKSNIIHFCFSCRMMDTMIENFIFKELNYPKISINGNVTIKLDKNLKINWIKMEKKVGGNIYNNTDDSLNHILFRGACDIQPLIPYLKDLPIVSDLNNLKNDTSIYHLTQNLSDELINIIKKDTCNLYNDDTFKININSNTDLIVFSLGDTYYQKILKHKETGILINNSRSIDEWKSSGSDKNLFDISYINENIFEKHLMEFIKLYKNKFIIFINCPEVESDDNLGYIFKKFNLILKKYIDNKNIFLVDITNIIKTKNDLRDNGKYITHYKRESYYNIAMELKNKINEIIEPSKNKIYFKEKFMTIYNKENIDVKINNNIVFLKIINTPKNNYGVSFFYNNNDNNNNKIKLQFECRIENNEDSKIYPRIYTGNKWIELKNVITTDYKKFELNAEFNFKNNSSWRLSSNSFYPSQIIYFRNIKFINNSDY